ncbi:hypothetical protein [Intestinibacter sp.]
MLFWENKKVQRNKEKKRQEKQKKLEEDEVKKVVKAYLAEEMRNNYISISNGITRTSYEIYCINKYLRNFLYKDCINTRELSERFLNILLDMYILCGDVKDYKDLGYKIFTSAFIKKISSKYFDEEEVEHIIANFENSVKNFENIKVVFYENNTPFEKGEKGGFIEIFKNLSKMNIDYILLGFIYNRYNKNISKFNERWLSLGQETLDFPPNESMQKEAYFIIQFGYAYVYMCYIVLLRKYKYFSGNHELMLVLNELKQGNKEFFEIIDDFYLTYSSLYKKSFNMSFTPDEIWIFVLKDENEKKEEIFRQCDYYKNIIKVFKFDKDFDRLIESIDKDIFLQGYKEKDWYIERNDHYLCNELFDYLLIKVMDCLSPQEFLDIISVKMIYVRRLMLK